MDLNSFINADVERKMYKICYIDDEGSLVKSFQKGTSAENALFLFLERNHRINAQKIKTVEDIGRKKEGLNSESYE